jgi:hypothetical protein
MGLLLALALLAGDPADEWSAEPASRQQEPVAAPPSSAPPAVAAQTTPAFELDASHPLERQFATEQEFGAGALQSTFRMGLQLDVGVSPDSMGQLGATFDLAWCPLRFLRLHASVGSAWVPTSRFQNSITSHGAVRLMAGADAVLPLRSIELFMGVETGTSYTDANAFWFGCQFGPCSSSWQWQPTLRWRAGFDVTSLRPVLLGLDAGYGYIAQQFGEMHFAELHGRLGFSL